MNLAFDRDCALGASRWAARRLATCEVHYFRSAARYARAGHERDRTLRERWRRLAFEFGEFLEDGLEQLSGLGLGEAARAIAEECGDRIGRGRADYCEAEGLDRSSRMQVPLAVEGSPGVSRVRAELN
jgi:hypothetical protein